MSPNLLRLLLIVPFAALAVAMSVLNFIEFFNVVIRQDPAGYTFGTTEAVRRGGWDYQSATHYAISTGATGVIFAVIAVLLFGAAFRPGRRKWLAYAAALFILHFLFVLIMNLYGITLSPTRPTP